jgi:hypothetical protein
MKKIVANGQSTQNMTACLHGLQNWQGTFLEGDMSLDDLLEKTEEGTVVNELAKTALLKTFVDILLIEGMQFFRAHSTMLTLIVEALLIRMMKSFSDHSLDQARLEVVSALFEDEVIDIATQRKGPLTTHGDELLAIDLIPDSLVSSHELENVATPSSEGQDSDLIIECISLLEAALEDLYDMLPMIRTMRRGHALDLEQRDRSEKPEQGANTAVLQIQDVLNEFDDVYAKLQVSGGSVDEKMALMATEERNIIAGFRKQLDDAQIQKNKQAEIQRILTAVKSSIETGPTVNAGASEGKAATETKADIQDPEKKRLHLQHMTENIRRGNEELRKLVRDVT